MESRMARPLSAEANSGEPITPEGPKCPIPKVVRSDCRSGWGSVGLGATAHIAYTGKVFVRGGPKHYAGEASGTIYPDGAKANIAEFYRCVTEGEFDNPTAHRSVDSHLTAILGREAMARNTRLTMDELIKENKKLEVDLTGLKA